MSFDSWDLFCVKHLKVFILMFLSLLTKCCTFSFSRIQNSLTDTKAFWCYFQKFVLIDEFDCLLEAENSWRCQFQSFIRGRRTCIGPMFCHADIQLDVFGLTNLPDDHTTVYFFARTNEECSTILR